MEVKQRMNGDLRRRILDTTRHLLVSEGYNSLSMRKIARAIGYSATSIYLHFESKDALVHALIEEGMAQKYETLRSIAEAHREDVIARLKALCRGYIDFGIDNPEYYEIMYMLHPEQMARFPAEKYRRARRNLEVIVDTLREGAEGKLLHVEDPLVAASAIWAALHGAVSLLFSRRMDVRVDREAFIDTVITQTLRSYIVAPEGVGAGASTV